MLDTIDQDSFEVVSWEALLIHARKTGQTKKYFEKLNKFILDSNAAVQRGIDKHLSNRVAEIRADLLEEAQKLKKEGFDDTVKH